VPSRFVVCCCVRWNQEQERTGKGGWLAMEDHFKQDDEITLAGVARQD